MPKLLKPYVRVGKGTFKGLFPKGKTPNCKITYAGEFGLFRLQHNRVKDIDHSCFVSEEGLPSQFQGDQWQ